MGKIITGLDIGTTQIKCVIIEEKKEGTPPSLISAFKHPSSGFKKGLMHDPEEAIQSLRNLILDLSQISKKSAQNIFANINSEHIKSLHSRGVAVVARADQEIQQDDIDRVFEAAQAIKIPSNHLILHNIIKDYYVDEIQNIQNPLGMIGNRLEVGTFIVLGFAPQINTLVSAVERVGGAIGGLIFSPIASAKAILSKRQKDLGVILIDFGASTTSLIIYEEGKVVHTKIIPFGANYITNDIAVGLRIPIDVAEKLKISYGATDSREISRREMIKMSEFENHSNDEISRRFLAEIIEVRLEELIDLINDELKSLSKNGKLPGGAVLVGGGAKLQGIADSMKKYLKLPVQVGFPNLRNFEIMNTSYEDLFDDPEFAVAAGLALWGVSSDDKSGFEPGAKAKSLFKRLLRSLET